MVGRKEAQSRLFQWSRQSDADVVDHDGGKKNPEFHVRYDRFKIPIKFL